MERPVLPSTKSPWFQYPEDLDPVLRDVRDNLDVLDSDVDDIQSGALPIALAGIEGALGEYEPLLAVEAQSGRFEQYFEDVTKHGATGNGSTDDTAAIQEAIDEGAPGVLFPRPSAYYRLTDTLVPLDNQSLVSSGRGLQYAHEVGGATKVRIGGAFDGPVIAGDGQIGVLIDGLLITGSGNSAHTNNIGLDLDTASFWTVRNSMFNNFAGPAIDWDAGVALRLYDNFTTNCLLARAGLSDYVGVFDLGGTDPFVAYNEIAASVNSVGNGYAAALAVRNANGFYISNVCEISEVGCVLPSLGASFYNVFLGNRADLNYGHGFIVNSTRNQFIGNRSVRNGLATNNTYDAFAVHYGDNTFMGNHVGSLSSDTNKMRYGFNDDSAVSDGNHSNVYLGNTEELIATALYNISDADNQKLDFRTRQTYAASNVTTDRTFDANSTTLDEVADVLGTLIADLRTQGVVR